MKFKQVFIHEGEEVERIRIAARIFLHELGWRFEYDHRHGIVFDICPGCSGKLSKEAG